MSEGYYFSNHPRFFNNKGMRYTDIIRTWNRLVIEGGPGSGHFGHTGGVGGPGNVGGSTSDEGSSGEISTGEEKVNWDKLSKKSEFNKIFKEKFRISRADTAGDMDALRSVGNHLTDLTERLPGLQDFMMKHKISRITIQSSNEVNLGGSQSGVLGAYEDKTSIASGGRITIAAGNRKWVDMSVLHPLGGDYHNAASLNYVGNTFNHELGHHFRSSLGTRQREKWADLVESLATKEKMSGENYIRRVISDYAGSYAKKRRMGGMEFDVIKSEWYSEAFSECFSRLAHRSYKGELPKEIESFMYKSLKIRK